MEIILLVLKDFKMRLSFKVSKYTILFSLYVIISASFMYQLLNFIRYDLWIPRKIVYKEFKEDILKKLENIKKDKENKKEKIKDIINKIDVMNKSYTYNEDDGYYYLNKKISIEDKEEIRYVFLVLDKKDILPIFIMVIFSIFGFVLLFYLISLKINIVRIILACIIFGLGLLYTFTINKYISERIHLIYFGIIGFLFAKDNFEELESWTILYVMLWAMIIATLDEIFQLFLPYRVGDVRDVIFGVLGGLWGGVIYITLYIKKIFKFNNIKRD